MGNGDAQGDDWEPQMWKAVEKENQKKEKERQDAANALEWKNKWDEKDRLRQQEIEESRRTPIPPPEPRPRSVPQPIPEPRGRTKPEKSGVSLLWGLLLVEVFFVGLGIYLHQFVEALLLINVAIGAFCLVIFSLAAFGRDTNKAIWLAWLPTIGIGFLVAKGVLAFGTFMFWLAIIGATFIVYSIYGIVRSLSHR